MTQQIQQVNLMIPVTRLDGQQVVINGDLVEKIESSPDTIISLTSGRKMLVRESVSDLMRLFSDARLTRNRVEPKLYSPSMFVGEAA